MSRVNINPQSPYRNTPQNSYFLDVWKPPAVAPSASDQTLVVDARYRHRPDLLAHDLYGSSQLWWVFAMVNPDQIRDPIYDLIPDITIRVPSSQSLVGFFG
jgi:hypothetical protein